MIRTCFLLDKKGNRKHLGKENKLPTLNGNAVRKINGRPEFEQNNQHIRFGEFYDFMRSQSRMSKEDFDNAHKVQMSAKIFGEIIFYPMTSKFKTAFDVQQVDRKSIHIINKPGNKFHSAAAPQIVMSNGGGSASVPSSTRRDISLSEEAKPIKDFRDLILLKIDATFLVIKAFGLRELFIVDKSVDAVYSANNSIRLTDLKLKSQGSMSKSQIMNKCLDQVAKSLAGNCQEWLIVLEDERERTSAGKITTLSKILFWSDILLLFPSNFITTLKMFMGELKTYLHHSSVFSFMSSIDINSDNITLLRNGFQNQIKISLKDTNFIPTTFRETPKDRMLCNVVVGKQIPLFEFDLQEVFVRYFVKQSWETTCNCKRLVILVEDNKGLREVLKNLKKNERQMELPQAIIFTKEEENREEDSLLHAAMEAISSYRFIRYESFEDVGEELFRLGITLIRQPIRPTLLLLGKDQRVPLRMPISQLSFMSIDQPGDLSLLPVPSIISAIGTLTECEDAEDLARNEFPCKTFIAFVMDNPGRRLPPNYIICKERTLEDSMMHNGVPMYKTFTFAQKWIAK